MQVLVTLGSEGAIYFDKSGGVTTQKGFQLGPAGVVDTTGAGDCYRGTFVAARYGRGMVLPAVNSLPPDSPMASMTTASSELTLYITRVQYSTTRIE